MTIHLPGGYLVHRVGGAEALTLRLRPADAAAVPPGLSVLLGGTAGEAAAQMRLVFKGRRWKEQATRVATSSITAIRTAGFDVIAASTTNLPNHGRIIHPEGIAGFTDENLAILAGAFVLTTGY